MAALERYFLSQGRAVAAYDRTPSELTRHLEEEGVAFCYDDDPALAIPEDFRNPEDTLVVFTPAVPADSAVMTWFREGGYRMIKRAQALGIITADSKAICFAGTHGKTTTSAMAAHILHTCSCGCNAFLGGILRNYDSNFLLEPTSPWTVAEADEYDRSFHHLHPHIAVTNGHRPRPSRHLRHRGGPIWRAFGPLHGADTPRRRARGPHRPQAETQDPAPTSVSSHTRATAATSTPRMSAWATAPSSSTSYTPAGVCAT